MVELKPLTDLENQAIKNWNDKSNEIFKNISEQNIQEFDEIIDALEDDNKHDNKHVINANLLFIDWYFRGEGNILDEREKQRIFNFMTYAMIEDPHCFMRIVLYIANTRVTDKQEIFYKIIIHFMGTMFPEIIMNNIELLTKLGKKDDVLYFVQCPGISARVITWIKHISKQDPDFNTLLNGKMIGSKIERVIRYRPKFGKDYKWNVFLFKILDEPKLNGILI